MNKLRLLLKDEKGSVMVIFALAMTALMGLTAMVVDVGLLYWERARLMDTADAAALGGAQELPASETEAETVASEYIARNGENNADFTVFAGDAPGYPGKIVRVTANTDVDFFFAPVLGIDKGNVGARAIATAGSAASALRVVPVGIPKNQPRIKKQKYTLKYNSSGKEEDVLGAGNFGALDLDGSNGGGASDYRERLAEGYEEILKVGDIIIPESGNMAGPTDSGLQTRLNSCPHSPKCTICHYEKDCPRIAIVPVYEIFEMQNKNKVKSMKVVGFAAFLLTDSRKGEIEGYFLDDVILPGDPDPNGENFGTYAVKLIE